MKHLLAVLLCLLLSGCAPQTPPDTEAPSETVPAKTSMYDPLHPIELAYPGEVRAYPLTYEDVHGILACGDDVLTLSGEEHTTLTLLTGDDLLVEAAISLDFPLSQDAPSLQIAGNCISFFDPLQQETIVLDTQLQEVRRITAPPHLSGSPIYSAEQNTLFYCTSYALVAWDLDSGIRRTVKELFYPVQELTGLHCSGNVLQCTIQEEESETKLLLAADTGTELARLSEKAVLNTGADRFFAALPAGNQTLLLFGQEGTNRILLPETYPQQQYYLPEDHAVVTAVSSENGIALDYYELNTGILRAQLLLDDAHSIKSIVNSKGHAVYLLAYDAEMETDILYRWDVLRQPPDPSSIRDYTWDYHPKEKPDLSGLEQCRKYAREIGEKYGITLQIWEDAIAVQPWDYRFEPEHLVPVLQRELKLLDQRLARYPKEVIQQTASHFDGLTICLVRQIQGITDSGSLSSATGIQFFQDGQAFVVLAVGKYSEQALYHELFHVMETHILTESTALDQWNDLNPPGFAYDNGYNPQRDSGIYLHGDSRAFVDTYSMSFPKEDRARILEYSMLPDNQNLFASRIMQQKLTAICSGIREAYHLKDYGEVLPWEQYLENALVPEA